MHLNMSIWQMHVELVVNNRTHVCKVYNKVVSEVPIKFQYTLKKNPKRNKSPLSTKLGKGINNDHFRDISVTF